MVEPSAEIIDCGSGAANNRSHLPRGLVGLEAHPEPSDVVRVLVDGFDEEGCFGGRERLLMATHEDADLIIDAAEPTKGLSLREEFVNGLVSEVFLDASLDVGPAEEDTPAQILVCFNYNEAVIKFEYFDEFPLSWSQVRETGLEVF